MHDGTQHPKGHSHTGAGEPHTHDHTGAGEPHTHSHTGAGEPHTHDHIKAGAGSSLTDKINMDKEKLIAILGFMKDHNHEHAGELRNLLGAIKELGADEIVDIVDIIENSAEAIEEAADNIGEALTLLAEL